MESKSCSCSRGMATFLGLPKINSSALFLVDPHQRVQLDMAGLQDHVDGHMSLPLVNVDRIIQFVNSFSPVQYRGLVEGSTVRISEEYVAASLKLIDSRPSRNTRDPEQKILRVCEKNLKEYQSYVVSCFEGGSLAEVPGKGWRKSQLHHRCKDIVDFVHQRLWGSTADAEFVDTTIVQSVLGIMSGKQFAWARHVSQWMKEDIARFQSGDEVYRSTHQLRSAQYLSIVIDFQIGPKVPPPDSTVTIVDVGEQLEAAEKQNCALSKRLKELEEGLTQLDVHAKLAATAAQSTEARLKDQLLKMETELAQSNADLSKAKDAAAELRARLMKAETELAQCNAKRVSEQTALSTKLREEKASSRDDLQNSEKQKSCGLLRTFKDSRKHIEAAADADFKDDLEARGNCKSIAKHVSAKRISGVVPRGSVSVEAVWAAADDLYLGHFGNLFSNWNVDFPYPKWEALWWIAKDYGQSPAPPEQRSLHDYYNMNSYRWSSEPPEEVSKHPHFCRLCDRRWMWFKDAKSIDAVYYNWPKIPLDLSTSRACSASYYAFYETHKAHLDPVCFRAAIFCAVLANWCSKFDFVIDANKGGADYQDMMLYVKLNYCSSRVVRVLELMCQLQFLYDSRRNIVLDHASRWGIANEWKRVQNGRDYDDRSGKRGRQF